MYFYVSYFTGNTFHCTRSFYINLYSLFRSCLLFCLCFCLRLKRRHYHYECRLMKHCKPLTCLSFLEAHVPEKRMLAVRRNKCVALAFISGKQKKHIVRNTTVWLVRNFPWLGIKQASIFYSSCLLIVKTSEVSWARIFLG